MHPMMNGGMRKVVVLSRRLLMLPYVAPLWFVTVMAACSSDSQRSILGNRDTAAGESASRDPIQFEATEVTEPEIAVSPSGKEMLFTLLGDIYTLDANEGGQARLLVGGPGWDASPRYSPDGTQVVFLSDRDGAQGVWRVPSQGGEPTKLLDRRQIDADRTPGGRAHGALVNVFWAKEDARI